MTQPYDRCWNRHLQNIIGTWILGWKDVPFLGSLYPHLVPRHLVIVGLHTPFDIFYCIQHLAGHGHPFWHSVTLKATTKFRLLEHHPFALLAQNCLVLFLFLSPAVHLFLTCSFHFSRSPDSRRWSAVSWLLAKCWLVILNQPFFLSKCAVYTNGRHEGSCLLRTFLYLAEVLLV